MAARLKSPPLTEERWQQYLDLVRQGTPVRKAARELGLSEFQTRKWRKERPEEWAEAEEEFIQTLEEEAHRRAAEGTEVNHYDRDGNLIRVERRYSDRLLELMLKRYRSEYRENSTVRFAGHDGGAVKIEHKGVTALADVFQLAKELGVDARPVIDGPVPRGALPRASEVLPDLPHGVETPGGLPPTP